MLPLALNANVQSTPFTFSVDPREGLSVAVAGVPVVSGAWFQVYEPDWSKQHFSSGQGGVVSTLPDGSIQVQYKGANGLFFGTQTYIPNGDQLRVHIRFEWNGSKPVRAEATAGMIQVPVIEGGSFMSGTRPFRMGAIPATSAPFPARRFGDDANEFAFDAPIGRIDVASTAPLTLFDARGYKQEWAEDKSLLWLGLSEGTLANGAPLEWDVEWRFRPNSLPSSRTITQNSVALPFAEAKRPDETLWPLVPRPKEVNLNWQKPIELSGLYRYPVGRVRFWNEYAKVLRQHFVLGPVRPGAVPVSVDAGVSNLERRPGAYEITIRPNGRVSVLGQEDEGLRNGLRRLGGLVFLRKGRLYLPTGTLVDEPALTWRGVHLFVGPEARAFQGRLWDRVLSPMFFNRVVLQCERTQWQSTDIDPSERPMKRADLVGLFDDYRKRGVEPIPLVQSLGHMGWFFAGGKRTSLAVNPETPFTLDFRKPDAVGAIRSLWTEVATVLQPKSFHFGCDEIGLRGFPADKTRLTTELWKLAMPELDAIAKEHNAQPMIWGDQALSPNEAIDAANGFSPAEAALRRSFIPKRMQVADWHYRDDARPEVFYPSLQLWRREGFTPIAAGWYRNNNVRGFALAADLERTGYLQTTWAGYESNEENMLKNLSQFSAMVLAADYAWSARQESVENVGYDPEALFRRMYFGTPSPLQPIKGVALGNGTEFNIGSIGFRQMVPIEMRSTLTYAGRIGPDEVDIPFRGKISHLALAIETVSEQIDGTEVAEVEIRQSDGRTVKKILRYGIHVRAASDRKPLPYSGRERGLAAFLCDFAVPTEIVSLKFRIRGPIGGLRLHGVTGWP